MKFARAICIRESILFSSLEPACLVHANILIDEKTFKVTGILDWKFEFSGSYLFDIGTLLRFDLPKAFEQRFIDVYKTLSTFQKYND